MPRTGPNQQGGRICLADDSFDNLAPEVQVRAEHIHAVNATKTKESADETHKSHRRCFKILINWWMDQYPDYFEAGTQVLSQEERSDPMTFYHTCDRDIIYEGLRVDMVTAFMAANKTKPGTQKLFSFTHMQKIHDAVLFYARTVKQVLSSSHYYVETESFLWSFKKAADARSRGNVDEKSADPISFSLFRLLILKWSLEEGNKFVWVWTILQWNLIARLISIDPLGLHNFSVSEDHYVIRYNSTKSDREGDRTHNKAVYCNPLDPLECTTGVSLGVWLSMEQRSFSDNQEKLFLQRGAKLGTAAHRYCDQLLTLVRGHWDIVQMHTIRTFSAHSITKESAPHVASATTSPPPIASIAHCGDWSLGQVLDVYWQFAESGDAYLERCLSGQNPNHSTFSVLLPHWNVQSAVEDEDISAGLEIMYGKIIQHHPGSIALLAQLLAAVTYSSDWLMEFTVDNRRHPFCAFLSFRTLNYSDVSGQK